MKKNKYKDMLDGLIDTTLLYACKEHKTFVEEDVAECRPLLDEACDKAEKYDEKETPKVEYQIRYAMGEKYKDVICANCGMFICYEPQLKEFSQKINYCHWCGQKLDWQQK